MLIKSLGGAGQVTGSCHHISASENFLLDCGLFQGPKRVENQNYQDLDIDIDQLDFVLVSHGHLDHCGRLPLLTKKGFRGPIYTTRASRDIIELVLLDSARIQELGPRPLYKRNDVLEVLSLIYPIKEGQVTKHGNTHFSFHPAGHLLGANWIKISSGGNTLAFSGDLGRYSCPYYPKPQDLGAIDYLILEGTIGTRLHPPIDKSLKDFYKLLLQAMEEKKEILIPAFSLGRTQEILSSMIKLAREDKDSPLLKSPIIIDSASAIEGFKLYQTYKDLHRIDIRDLFPDNLFLGDYRQAPKDGNEIIISASGMMEGGPVLHHAKRILARDNGLVFITGFQAEETLGRKLLEGAKEVQILGEKIQIKAQIIDIPGLSGHADRDDLKRFVDSSQGLEKIFLVHGQPQGLEDLKAYLEKDYKVSILKENKLKTF